MLFFACNVSVQKNLAKAEQVSGVYIFTDCTPMGKYKVLGDVPFGGKSSAAFMSMSNGTSTSTMLYVSGSDAQYTSIRNGLVANALMANREVEGIILHLEKEGEGRATMIKFLDGEDKAICKVVKQQGLYVFCDCKPIEDYDRLGEIVGAGSLSILYSDLRNKLIKKVHRKYKTANGLILHLVEGGRDRADAILFEE